MGLREEEIRSAPTVELAEGRVLAAALTGQGWSTS